MAKNSAICVLVYDGDSFRIQFPNNQTDEIRLARVDCPEINSPNGQYYKNLLVGLIMNQAISYEGTARDTYNRLIAEVWKGSLNVNDYMISKGCKKVG